MSNWEDAKRKIEKTTFYTIVTPGWNSDYGMPEINFISPKETLDYGDTDKAIKRQESLIAVADWVPEDVVYIAEVRIIKKFLKNRNIPKPKYHVKELELAK